MMLPNLKRLDPKGVRFSWLRRAFEDRSSRVRIAALNGFLLYPKDETIPLLIDNMARMDKEQGKSKPKRRANFKEWVLTRYTLEQLTGQFYGDEVKDWQQWWAVAKDHFSLKKRVEEEKGDDGPRTVVVRSGGVEVAVNMSVAGKEGAHPILVLPLRQFQPDYFRPYFHGIEDAHRVYYLHMPQIGDFKGLARGTGNNMITYPTRLLAEALSEYMSETGLEQFAVLAHGPASSTLGMMLTANYPDQVSELVLINPLSAGNRYGAVLDNVQKEGRKRKNDEVIKGVDMLQQVDREGNTKYTPADSAERAGLGRAISNLNWADPTMPEQGTRKFLYNVPQANTVMNDSSWVAQDDLRGRGSAPPSDPHLSRHPRRVDAPRGGVARGKVLRGQGGFVQEKWAVAVPAGTVQLHRTRAELPSKVRAATTQAEWRQQDGERQGQERPRERSLAGLSVMRITSRTDSARARTARGALRTRRGRGNRPVGRPRIPASG